MKMHDLTFWLSISTFHRWLSTTHSAPIIEGSAEVKLCKKTYNDEAGVESYLLN